MNRNPPPNGRKRAAGEMLREVLIRRREAYFDLLVSGCGVEQIASHTKKSPAAERRAVGQALAKRRLDAPEDDARLRVARLTEALRCADVSLAEGDPKAIAPFVKVVRELNLYHGDNVCPARLAPETLPEIAPSSRPLVLTHLPSVVGCSIVRGRKKLRERAVKLLKSFARVNLCASGEIRSFDAAELPLRQGKRALFLPAPRPV